MLGLPSNSPLPLFLIIAPRLPMLSMLLLLSHDPVLLFLFSPLQLVRGQSCEFPDSHRHPNQHPKNFSVSLPLVIPRIMGSLHELLQHADLSLDGIVFSKYTFEGPTSYRHG